MKETEELVSLEKLDALGLPDVSQAVGRVGAPKGFEATSQEFFFWVPEDRVIEKTQLVYASSPAGTVTVTYYGLVSEVFRRSRRQDMLEEADRFDGRPEEEVPFDSRGVTYAQARLLAADPKILTAPREESHVFPAGEPEARIAYGVDDMGQPCRIGLIRNGGDAVAGPAFIDLDYLLGAEGGHMNVTGIAGVGTKSSFLTVVLSQLLRAAATRGLENPNDPDRIQLRPVILNVKGFDLFWLDHWSSSFMEDDQRVWREMGWAEPEPLSCDFFAPQQPGSDNLAVPVGRDGVAPYSWSLTDVVESNLFVFLFNDSDRDDDNFALLVSDIERLMMQEHRANDGRPIRQMRDDAPAQTFQELFDWFENNLRRDDDQDHTDPRFDRLSNVHHPGTLRRFYRRLRRIVYESSGIFRLGGHGSHPLDITTSDPGRPVVVDIQGLPDRHLQRFVVAALLKQAVDHQTGPQAIRGMHYLFVLDELNRFAPKGHRDPITQLIETVAAELRSRGVILLGAQQQASLVSARVVENAAIRVLGRTGGHELSHDVFSFLRDQSTRDYVEQLDSPDKVVYQPNFRAPMNVRVPRPPWAMRKQEASTQPPLFMQGGKARAVGTGPKTLTPKPLDELP